MLRARRLYRARDVQRDIAELTHPAGSTEQNEGDVCLAVMS